jgi:hypothetical protein
MKKVWQKWMADTNLKLQFQSGRKFQQLSWMQVVQSMQGMVMPTRTNGVPLQLTSRKYLISW